MDRNCRLKKEALFSVVVIIFLGASLIYWKKTLKKDTLLEIQDGKSVNILLPPFDRELNPSRITSASTYILISHLVRTLVKTDESLQIHGDLAEKWTVADNFTSYTFFIGPNHLFSDGSPITAQDLEHSISKQIEEASAIHFNFSSITSVSTKGNLLKIKLNLPSPNFLYKLTHPEFGALHSSDYKKGGHVTFNTTSGPYILSDSREHLAILEKNKHYDPKSESPRILKFYGQENINVVYDFIFSTHPNKNFNLYVKDKNYQITQPHIGFTFWLNINHESFTSSQRHFLQNSLSGSRLDYSSLKPYWAPARQLYLPDGFGRLNGSELDNIWGKIEASASSSGMPKSISVLLYEKFPKNEELIESLSKLFETVKIETYDNMKSFDDLSKRHRYDLKMINNDFASSDVTENILVALNKKRPLIDAPKDHKIFKLITNAESTDNIDHKGECLKEIELEVLRDALIIPLAYLQVIFYLHPDLDISNWSMLSPEISFWKARWKD